MGITHSNIELINLKDRMLAEDNHIPQDKIRKMTISMMVDSGALMLAINENIKSQLGLVAKDKQFFTLADGQLIEMEIVGGIEVRFKNRWCTTDAVVLKGDTEPLFGALPMEAMDLVIHPTSQSLDVNPKHPYRPQHVMAGFR